MRETQNDNQIGHIRVYEVLGSAMLDMCVPPRVMDFLYIHTELNFSSVQDIPHAAVPNPINPAFNGMILYRRHDVARYLIKG